MGITSIIIYVNKLGSGYYFVIVLYTRIYKSVRHIKDLLYENEYRNYPIILHAPLLTPAKQQQQQQQYIPSISLACSALNDPGIYSSTASRLLYTLSNRSMNFLYTSAVSKNE